nr:FHA domain-containing protein [uncultured Holophaga sp.]
MIITCPACSGRFQYDETRFQGLLSKRFKCPKCQHIFEVENPALPPAPQPSVPPPQAAPVQTAPDAARETTARKDRGVMLGEAGIQGMPQGFRISIAFLSGSQASTVRLLDKPQTLIGREEGDIVTLDPETSRRHAMIEVHPDGTVWLEDLGSTNGTFLEGAPLGGPVQLHDRQEFTCGQSTFMVLIRKYDGTMELT